MERGGFVGRFGRRESEEQIHQQFGMKLQRMSCLLTRTRRKTTFLLLAVNIRTHPCVGRGDVGVTSVSKVKYLLLPQKCPVEPEATAGVNCCGSVFNDGVPVWL